MQYNEIKVGPKEATLYTYLLDANISYDTSKKWPAVLVMPGGGYLFTSTREGESIATKFFGAGYSCFILRYNTKVKNRITHEMNEDFSYPDPSIELLEALHVIFENADKWHIDPDRIYINGYSAGAHITLTALLRGREKMITDRLSFSITNELNIRGLIFGYPMIEASLMNPIFQAALLNQENPSPEELKPLDMTLYLKKDCCPMFIWQTANDQVVNPPVLCRFVAKAVELGIPMEFHLFEDGPHGLAMADERYAKVAEDINPSVAVWFDMAVNWMKRHN